jgi:hypothetical protein
MGSNLGLGQFSDQNLGLLAQFSARLLIEPKGSKWSPIILAQFWAWLNIFKTNEKRLNLGRILSRAQNWAEKQAQLSEKFLLGLSPRPNIQPKSTT